MKEQIKKFLNEEQDPKAVEKTTAKLEAFLMQHETIGYIAVQKKPAVTVFPDSIVLTNKRIIICQPKNLGLSMHFEDYAWDKIEGTFIKENILGAEFSFSTLSGNKLTIDFIPKIQARKLYTYAKEQLELLKSKPDESNSSLSVGTIDERLLQTPEVETYEAELLPESAEQETVWPPVAPIENVSKLTQEELFEKLQNYKKLLDNGLILQGEYDAFKKEILSQM